MEDSIARHHISILLCTSTLAEGVNMPIRTLVLHTLKRYDSRLEQWRVIPRRSIKNIIGRVGRAGKETRGRVIFANPSDRDVGIEVLNGNGLEPAKGRLFELVTLIARHLSTTSQELTNNLLEAQNAWFLELVDSIDQCIIELLPAATEESEINASIDELIERTLAHHEGGTAEFRTVLRSLFVLRGQRLQTSVSAESWNLLKRSGTKLRLWKKIDQSGLLAEEIWQTLDNPLNEEWLDKVVKPLILTSDGSTIDRADQIVALVKLWISGSTYIEMAQNLGLEIDEVLSLLCREVGFELQEATSKACQLVMAQYGEDSVSETAQAWPSLLQFGLGNLQQLDLFEAGLSDRMGAWGIHRFMEVDFATHRGANLLRYLRRYSEDLEVVLKDDGRVPQLSLDRVLSELRIND